MKLRGYFVYVFLIFFILLEKGFCDEGKIVDYKLYNWNLVYRDLLVEMGSDYVFVITSSRSRNFPSIIDSEGLVKGDKTQRVVILPSFLSIKMGVDKEAEVGVEEKVVFSNETKEVGMEKEVFKDEREKSDFRFYVYFPFNSSRLVADQKSYLISKVKEYRERRQGKEILAEVRGYTCVIGDKWYNKRLSLNRARVVAKELEKMGIKVVKVEGLGKTAKSEVLCLNRQVEVILK